MAQVTRKGHKGIQFMVTQLLFDDLVSFEEAKLLGQRLHKRYGTRYNFLTSSNHTGYDLRIQFYPSGETYPRLNPKDAAMVAAVKQQARAYRKVLKPFLPKEAR